VIERFLIWIRSLWQGSPVSCDRGLRSGKWPAVRRLHLEKEPCCQWCGGKSVLEVHHILPFHVNPSMELEDSNLITLCESISENCHFIHGHNRCWRNSVPTVRTDCEKHRKEKS
jgi:5-methylcytosine-specific restriction enzyme A